MVVCGCCGSKVDRDSESKIQCADCSFFFHGNCVSLEMHDIAILIKEKQLWRCEKCVTTRKTFKRNTITSTPTIAKVDIAPKQSLSTEYHDEEVLNEIKLLRMDLSTKLQQFSVDFKLLEYNLTTKINSLVEENRQLKQDNQILTVRLNYIEQSALNNCVDIIGIPSSANENIEKIVSDLFTKCLNVSFNADDIDVVYRKKSANTNVPVHVKFKHNSMKDVILKAVKEKRKMFARQLGFNVNSRIFINQCLIPAKRTLYKAAIDLKKDGKCKYVWIKNGNILIRKIEGGRVTKIADANDLAQFS